ncbi:MAG TPA: cysteine desulfurase family protein [Chitinophagaceae bacterium]|nr:cysteine desulfurase family protein [Chitinophagaceae bacterium]
MKPIYLDNAATTPLDPEVLNAMLPYLTEHFGNASSIYSLGRECRMAIEKARKSVAAIFNTSPGEIFFTSCGTESSNTAIHGAVRDLGCRHIISSPIEHHATLHTVEYLAAIGACRLSFVNLTQDGHIDMIDLERLLKESGEKSLVTLMHANNEIGNLLDVDYVAQLCQTYDAIFHTDAVQSIAHYSIDLQKAPIHFMSGSAHKFYGPKGSGILYVNRNVQIKPFINGGSQERQMRAGTENVAGIVGFSKALELATATLEADSIYIESLKSYMREQLSAQLSDVRFNGAQDERSLYTVLSVSLPANERSEMLSMNLDIAGICVSGGSACTSGAQGGSHVIKAVYPHEHRVTIRFSFSKHNTFDEVDQVVKKVAELL